MYNMCMCAYVNAFESYCTSILYIVSCLLHTHIQYVCVSSNISRTVAIYVYTLWNPLSIELKGLVRSVHFIRISCYRNTQENSTRGIQGATCNSYEISHSSSLCMLTGRTVLTCGYVWLPCTCSLATMHSVLLSFIRRLATGLDIIKETGVQLATIVPFNQIIPTIVEYCTKNE